MNERHPGTSLVYRLKVTLRASKPPIWRRLQVAGGVTIRVEQILTASGQR